MLLFNKKVTILLLVYIDLLILSGKVEIEGIELGINQRGIVIFMSNWLKLNDFITRKIITRMPVKGTMEDAHLILNKLL